MRAGFEDFHPPQFSGGPRGRAKRVNRRRKWECGGRKRINLGRKWECAGRKWINSARK